MIVLGGTDILTFKLSPWTTTGDNITYTLMEKVVTGLLSNKSYKLK